IGSPLEEIDWLHTILASPHVIAGRTTMERTWGVSEGGEPEKRPVDLDLYVDCSGSMPNPQVTVSYLALAGAIVALSALRVGARDALANAGTGGTLVLNLWRDPAEIPELGQAQADGWRVHRVRDWEELVAFASAFSKSAYEQERVDAARRRPGSAGVSPA